MVIDIHLHQLLSVDEVHMADECEEKVDDAGERAMEIKEKNALKDKEPGGNFF